MSRSHKPKHILVVGYYGYGNAGDDVLLLHTLARLSRSFGPTIHVNILSSSASRFSSSFYSKLDAIIPKNRLSFVSRFNALALLFAIVSSDAVVYGGGSLFQNKTSQRSLVYYAGIAWFAHKFGLPVYYLGQGIGPVKGWFARTLTKKAVQIGSWVEVRDKGSLEWCKGHTQLPSSLVTFRPDMVFESLVNSDVSQDSLVSQASVSSQALEVSRASVSPKGSAVSQASVVSAVSRKCEALRDSQDSPVPEGSKKMVGNVKKIGVCLHKDMSQKEHSSAKSMIEALQTQGDVQILVAHRGQDADKHWLSANHITGVKPVDVEPLLIRPLDSGASNPHLDVVVSMRYHVCVWAAMHQIPFIGVSDDPKIKQLCEQFGMPCEASLESIQSILNTWNMKGIRPDGDVAKTLSDIKKQVKMDAFVEHLNPQANIKTIVGSRYLVGSKQHILDKLLRDSSKSFGHLITINPEIFIQLDRNLPLKKECTDHALFLVDGVGLEKAFKWLGFSHVTRLPGVELAEAILEKGGVSVALVGATQDVLNQLKDRVKTDWPTTTVVFAHHGYFKTSEQSSILASVQQSNPDVVLVALGHPRQDEVIIALKQYMNRGLAIGVGGTFDILSGHVRRAPKWVRTCQLEWLYRSLQQPSRVSRLKKIPQFLWLVAKLKVSKPSSY